MIKYEFTTFLCISSQLCQWIWSWFVVFKHDALPKGPYTSWCPSRVTYVSVLLLCTFSFVWTHISLHQTEKLIIQTLPWVFSDTINIQNSPEQTDFSKGHCFGLSRENILCHPYSTVPTEVAKIYYYTIFLIIDCFAWLLKVSKYIILLEVA